MSRAQRHIDGLLKPVGSLAKAGGACHTTGRNAGVEWHTACGQAVLVMRADHGVWEEGVAISPKEVTAIQAGQITRANNPRVCAGRTSGR
ncbi:nicotinate-nucleotide--dimethylbenzimidazole phosphoribosyltransferase [Escherichia coli]